jgi:hypothetical protein
LKRKASLLNNFDVVADAIKGADDPEECVRIMKAWKRSSRRSARDKAKSAVEAKNDDDEVREGRGRNDVDVDDGGDDDGIGGVGDIEEDDGNKSDPI